jgi:hypothetical protein
MQWCHAAQFKMADKQVICIFVLTTILKMVSINRYKHFKIQNVLNFANVVSLYIAKSLGDKEIVKGLGKQKFT